MVIIIAGVCLAVAIVLLLALRGPGSSVVQGDLTCKASDKQANAVNLPEHDLAAKKVLVTQGCSFVGKHIVEKLFTIPSVKDIVVFDKRKTFDSMRVTFLQRDILRKEEIMAALEGVDLVIHCPSVEEYKDDATAVNVVTTGTKNLLEACNTMGVSRLVFVGDARVAYGGKPLTSADETSPAPSTFLPRFKALKKAEDMVLAAASTMQVIALRPAGVFGPREPIVLPALAKSLQTNKSIPVVGSGKAVVDCTFVFNVVFFITNSDPMPFWDFAGTVLTSLKYKGLMNPLLVKFMSQHRYYSCALAQELLQYRPVWSVQEGINLTARSFRSLRNPNATEKTTIDMNNLPEYTAEEVARHSTDDDAWLIVDGLVYDVSEYVLRHPGGDAIMTNMGRDVSVGFHGPQHPKSVYDTVKNFLIGRLVEE